MLTTFATEEYFDSRDAQERIDELESDIEAMEDDEETTDDEIKESDEYQELEILKELKDDVNTSEWDCGVNFIAEDEFEDYAQELAIDIGAINSDMTWPANCINWNEAADELQMDYSDVELEGNTFYYRS